MKKLYLTAVITVPSEEGQKRIDEVLEKETLGVQNIFRDDYGRSREDYEEMNMRIPSYFDEEEAEFYKKSPKSEISEDGYMTLAPEEIDYAFLDFILPLREFVSVTDTLEFGSLVKDNIVTLCTVKFDLSNYVQIKKSDIATAIYENLFGINRKELLALGKAIEKYETTSDLVEKAVLFPSTILANKLIEKVGLQNNIFSQYRKEMNFKQLEEFNISATC